MLLAQARWMVVTHLVLFVPLIHTPGLSLFIYHHRHHHKSGTGRLNTQEKEACARCARFALVSARSAKRSRRAGRLHTYCCASSACNRGDVSWYALLMFPHMLFPARHSNPQHNVATPWGVWLTTTTTIITLPSIPPFSSVPPLVYPLPQVSAPAGQPHPNTLSNAA